MSNELPPLPSLDSENWSTEAFSPLSPAGMETVDALRPARAPYICTNPNAPALVLVPGWTMNARGYVRQLPLGAVADLHTLQANNNAVNGEAGFGHFARHVEEYVIAKKLEERPGGFVIAGSSMGGAVSLAICARGRVKPRALILIGSFADCRHLPFYQRFLAPLAWVMPMDFGKRMLRLGAGFVRSARGAFGRDFTFMASTHISRPRGYYGRAVMALTRQNQIPQIKEFKLPTLVLHGTKDWVLPHAAGVEMAQTIPGARFVSIEGAGHLPFVTHAEIVNAEIAEFLTSID